MVDQVMNRVDEVVIVNPRDVLTTIAGRATETEADESQQGGEDAP